MKSFCETSWQILNFAFYLLSLLSIIRDTIYSAYSLLNIWSFTLLLGLKNTLKSSQNLFNASLKSASYLYILAIVNSFLYHAQCSYRLWNHFNNRFLFGFLISTPILLAKLLKISVRIPVRLQGKRDLLCS